MGAPGWVHRARMGIFRPGQPMELFHADPSTYATPADMILVCLCWADWESARLSAEVGDLCKRRISIGPIVCRTFLYIGFCGTVASKECDCLQIPEAAGFFRYDLPYLAKQAAGCLIGFMSPIMLPHSLHKSAMNKARYISS